MAADLDITNGHAARMRFSRFKQHMEGVPPTPRKPRASGGHRQKKAKHGKTVDDEKKPKSELDQYVKSDPGQMTDPGDSPFGNPDPFVKAERTDNDGVAGISLSGNGYGVPMHPANLEMGDQMPMDGSSSTFDGDFASMEGSWTPLYPMVKTESNIKMEPAWGS